MPKSTCIIPVVFPFTVKTVFQRINMKFKVKQSTVATEGGPKVHGKWIVVPFVLNLGTKRK
jgi:hypothetical protein